jgi:endonuclease YncB( thermonuclease family)
MLVLANLHVEVASAQAACSPEPSEPAAAARVIDGASFVATDGRTVRLAAIVAPAGAPGTGPAAAATAALSALVTGRDLRLKRIEPGTDRHGAALARAFAAGDGALRPVEADLVAQGHAYAKPIVGDAACTAALLSAERTARAQKRGIWADPFYDTKKADTPAAVMSARGRFAVVEGRVVSVRESGGTVYVNFGRRWSEDFTVTILKRNVARFTAAGLDPKGLSGRRVLVRGWVEERGGPWIEALGPEQIEVADR